MQLVLLHSKYIYWHIDIEDANGDETGVSTVIGTVNTFTGITGTEMLIGCSTVDISTGITVLF